LLGLGIGLIVGAGAMYLTLRPPWGGGDAPLVADARIAAPAPDAGVPGKSKPRAQTRTRPGRGGTIAAPPGSGELEETEPPPPPLTEADRRLEWRGDDVALPPRSIDMTSSSEARPLDDGEINAVISGQSGDQTGDVKDCVRRGATGTDLRATISVKLLVDGTGRVTRSRLQAPRYLFEQGLLACAQRALGRMKFPATGAPTVVSFPVNLG
jgi:hypothetical protein